MRTESEALPAHRRWLPRFSLRTLLIAVTGICVPLGAFVTRYGAQEAEYHRQQQIARSIESHGSRAIWESNLPNWLSWMRCWRLADPFRRLARVDFEIFADDHNRAVLGELPKLGTVRYIDIHVSALTDDALDTLAHMPSLKTLLVNLTKDEEGVDAPWNGLSWEEVILRRAEIDKRLPGVVVISGADAN